MGWLRDFFTWLFTGTAGCAACGDFNLAGDLHFCFHCLDRISYITKNYCKKCGKLLLSGTDEGICPSCRTDGIFQQGRPLGLYSGLLRKLILEMKYSGRRQLGYYLGEMMAVLAEQAFSETEVIIPIPLSAKRREERGYNQSYLLAVPVARRLGIPIFSGVLYRGKDTIPQSLLSTHLRKDNIKDAFNLRSPQRLSGRSILLLDDIITTGSTIREAGKMLSKAEPASISVMTLAASLPGAVDGELI